MDNTIVITLIPVLMYGIAWYWSNGLINSKIKSKANRKKYKRYFNKDMGFVFGVLTSAAGLSAIFFRGHVVMNRDMMFKIIILAINIFAAALASLKLSLDIKEIKNYTEEELIESIPKRKN